MNGRTSPNFLNILDEHLNNADLRELAREIGTDYENLAGDTKRGRILSLIEYVEQRKQVDELWALVVAKRPFLHPEGEAVKMRKFSVEAIKWIALVLGVIAAIIAIVEVLPNDEKILLQVLVRDVEGQQAIPNATVLLDVANELFPQKHTDANGRAVFELSPAFVDDLATVTVQVDGQTQTQTITVDFDMQAVEFQIRP
jgi:hypothetical protein